MRKFIIHFFFILLSVVALMYCCDALYSKIYKDCAPRNKLQYILKLKNQQYDVVFLGSSRVANHIDTNLFTQLSGKKSINLGVEGAGLNDNLLELKLLLKTNKVESIFIQIDTNIEQTGPSNIVVAEAMPFIDNTTVKEHVQQYIADFWKLNHIPFYRYAVNDPKIGFRECFFSAINKKPGTDPSIGFTPRQGNAIPDAPRTVLHEKQRVHSNAVFDEITALCKENKVELFTFITPYCSKIVPNGYVLKLKEIAPNLIDLTQGYGDELFFNCNHLNDKGAEKLTVALYEATK